MKTIAIYRTSLQLSEPTYQNKLYWEAYADLIFLLRARGVAAYFVTGNETYDGEGRFTKAYTLDQMGEPEQLRNVGPVRADLVFNRGDFMATDVPMVNPTEVQRLGDKIAAYQLFGQFQAHSIVCRTRSELQAATTQIKTDLIVVKTPNGSGGKGVYIGTRAEVMAKVVNEQYPLLMQEFMDTSGGIPGIAEGLHDLRIVLVGGEIVSCDIRTPKPGEYRANVSQGGSVKYIALSKIPKPAIRISRYIDAHFGVEPRFYAIDLARTTQGWKVIELNARPAPIPISYGNENAYVLHKLADHLVRSLLPHKLGHRTGSHPKKVNYVFL